MSKKAQIGIEFLFIVSAALFFFMLIIGAIYSNISDKENEKEAKEVNQLALSIKTEIDTAYKTSNGYSRKFYVPAKIQGKDYELKIEDQHIYILTDRNSASYNIKEIVGDIKKEDNLIKKENGIIYLNP